MKLEWLSYPKMYLICTVYLCIGTVLGITGYLAMMQQKILAGIQRVSVVEVSSALSDKNGKADLVWKEVEVYKNIEYGFEISYPKDMTEGIPSVAVADAPKTSLASACPIIDDTAKTYDTGLHPKLEGEKTIINNINYCKYESAEGAAGTTIENFIYTTVIDKKLFTITLNEVGFPNCINYAEQKAQEDCEKSNEGKRQTIEQILSTFKFTGK